MADEFDILIRDGAGAFETRRALGSDIEVDPAVAGGSDVQAALEGLEAGQQPYVFSGDWEIGTTYGVGEAVRREDIGDFKLYISLTNGNIGNDPVAGAPWLDVAASDIPVIVWGNVDPNSGDGLIASPASVFLERAGGGEAHLNLWDGDSNNWVDIGAPPTLAAVLGEGSSADGRIVDLDDPVDPQDAATKAYVDGHMTVRTAAGVPSGAPSDTEVPFAFDTTAITGGFYYWNGSAWVKVATIL